MTQETTHTPEPWQLHHDYNKSVIDREGLLICTTGHNIAPHYQSANAARIVACVNACEGMADPAAEIAALKAQRDELLAAINVCAASLCTYGSHPIIEKQVNNAINKAKGGRP